MTMQYTQPTDQTKQAPTVCVDAKTGERKRYEQLRYFERARLKENDPALYKIMRLAWLAAGQPPLDLSPPQAGPKAYRDMRPLERARLSQSDPQRYARERAEWIAAGSPPREGT